MENVTHVVTTCRRVDADLEVAVIGDNRLSRMLHMLLHIDLHAGAATSETIASMLGTNPVVVRRMMAGLREAGYVTSTRGPGGGWCLARGLDEITVLDVHAALGNPPALPTTARQDHPGCPVEHAVNATLRAILAEAEATVRERYQGVTLADIARALETLPAKARPQ